MPELCLSKLVAESIVDLEVLFSWNSWILLYKKFSDQQKCTLEEISIISKIENIDNITYYVWKLYI